VGSFLGLELLLEAFVLFADGVCADGLLDDPPVPGSFLAGTGSAFPVIGSVGESAAPAAPVPNAVNATF